VNTVGLPKGAMYADMFAKANAQLKDLMAESGFRDQELKVFRRARCFSWVHSFGLIDPVSRKQS